MSWLNKIFGGGGDDNPLYDAELAEAVRYVMQEGAEDGIAADRAASKLILKAKSFIGNTYKDLGMTVPKKSAELGIQPDENIEMEDLFLFALHAANLHAHFEHIDLNGLTVQQRTNMLDTAGNSFGVRFTGEIPFQGASGRLLYEPKRTPGENNGGTEPA